MARMGRGRKRKSGPRFPSGKLRQVRDYGNARVQAHREIYLRHGGVKASDDLHSALGQAHAAGLLEGTRVDGRALLEHGREWHRLYRATFGGSIRTYDLERVGRTVQSLAETGADRRYLDWAAIVAALTALERRCLNLVCVEYGDSWTLPPFLERLVNRWKARQRPPLYAGRYLPIRGDEEKMDALKAALLALVEGNAGRRRPHVRPEADRERNLENKGLLERNSGAARELAAMPDGKDRRVVGGE